MPKISIITICYNEPDVEKTCESIVNQTWQDFEWIVVDGGSNKETLDVFEKYKSRMTVFISEPDEGIYNASNKGIKFASCENVILMNAGDCFYKNSVLEELSSLDLSNKIIYSDVFLCNNDEPNKIELMKKEKNIISPTFFLKDTICTQAMIIPKIFFEKYGFFDEGYKIAADLERWIIFAKKGVSFKYVETPIAIYNIDGISGNKKYQQLHNEERLDIYNKHFSKKEIDKALNNIKYSLFERIFSIKNGYLNTHKIITILGFKIKIKRSK